MALIIGIILRSQLLVLLAWPDESCSPRHPSHALSGLIRSWSYHLSDKHDPLHGTSVIVQ